MQQHFADEKDSATHTKSMIRFFDYQRTTNASDDPVPPNFFCIPYSIESECYRLLRICQFKSSGKKVKLIKKKKDAEFNTKFTKIVGTKGKHKKSLKVAQGKDKKLYSNRDECISIKIVFGPYSCAGKMYEETRKMVKEFLKNCFGFEWENEYNEEKNFKQLDDFLIAQESKLNVRIREEVKKHMQHFGLIKSSIEKILKQLEFLFDNDKKFKFSWVPFFKRGKSQCIDKTGFIDLRDRYHRNGFLLAFEYKQLYNIWKGSDTKRRELKKEEARKKTEKLKKERIEQKKKEEEEKRRKQKFVKKYTKEFNAWLEVGYTTGKLSKEFFEKSLANLKSKVSGESKRNKKRKRAASEDEMKKKKRALI